MKKLTSKGTPQWQRESALLLHNRFQKLEENVRLGSSVTSELLRLTADLKNIRVGPEGAQKSMKCSKPTLERKLSKWREGERCPEALIPNYKKGAAHRIPDELIAEYQRLCTRPTGGRNKHGATPMSVAYNQLVKNWKQGLYVPGLGTWQDWWQLSAETQSYPLPSDAPEFPFTAKAFRRHQPAKAISQRGARGAVAAKNFEHFIERDYSKLRKGELYTLDDARCDFVAINELTGRVEEVGVYLFMEVGSRSIVSFVAKPRSAILQEDVDELIAYGLQTPGYGVGVDYPSYILFERGTVACSEAAQFVLEGMSNNNIKVIRTSINTGVRWVGAAPDRAKGNAAGKSVIESFFRRFHHELLHLPGQRGNTWENAPENLGFGRNHDTYRPFLDEDKEADRQKLGQSAAAERLAQFQRRLKEVGCDADIELPLLTFNQVRAAITKAIEHLNNDRGHDYQGHSQIDQIEVAPGVWKDLKQA